MVVEGLFALVFLCMVLAFVSAWVAGMTLQILVLRDLRRLGIQGFSPSPFDWTVSSGLRFTWFLLRRQYNGVAAATPALVSRCNRLRWLFVSMLVLMPVIGGLIVLHGLRYF